MPGLSDPIYTDDNAARAHLEALRWPNGPVCPHCSTEGNAAELKGKSTRPGVYKCRACRQPFSVTVGTVFERSKIPLSKWLAAVFLICSSKKGISSHQIHRTLGVTYKTAWFMTHRIREAMRTGGLAPMGGNGGIVEADETFFGKEPGKKKRPGVHHKMKVLSLVDRETKQVRSCVVDDLKPSTLLPILKANIAAETRLMTDEAGYYHRTKAMFATHETVCHKADEYVRGDVTTNTVESYFSTFKRGMVGVYQHCAKEHLHRYLAEFDFRYNNRAALGVNDAQRARNALLGIGGKRLTYRRPGEA